MLKNNKSKIILVVILFLYTLFIANNVYAMDETKKLYQDITINKDGSITIIEAAVLDGEYNGREREIEFKNIYSTTFTGEYSNFTGSTDIYNGTSIENIEIYDISQRNFNTIYDLYKKEKTYKKVDKASKGTYGVYIMDSYSYGADFRIYCPSSKEKVFMIKYTIADAVVIHNDVAELYWNVIGDDYREDIKDFQVLIHLPDEDEDLRIWTHGPLTGTNEIVDSKTIYFKDKNVPTYTEETIRIMFDKNLVPDATKKTNINGKENILKYEAEMADASNYIREKSKLEKLNKIEQYILDLDEEQSIFYYNRAVDLVHELSNEINENDYLSRIENYKDAVNEKWKKSIQSDITFLTDSNYRFLREYGLTNLKEDIEEGFDENAKEEFLKEVKLLENALEQKYENIRKKCTTIVYTIFIIVTLYIIAKLTNYYEERNKYLGTYYREFPSDDEPYILEYLMKRKITNLSFSATILSLISKKVIEVEKITTAKKDLVKFVLINKNYEGTEAEKVVLDILFKLVGRKGSCTLEGLKNYGDTTYKAKRLIEQIKNFKEKAEKEAKDKNYFDIHKRTIIEKILVIIIGIIVLLMAIGVFYKSYKSDQKVLYIIVVSSITLIYFLILNKDKNRSTIGKKEYSKWLAHKRFLNDFSKFKEKDLPEVILWERYLVTATILGCADKVERKLKMYINNTNIDSNSLLIATSLDKNLIRTINSSVKATVKTANNKSRASTSSYDGWSSESSYSSYSSSSSGHGGGSSSGGSGGRRWRRRPILSL